MKSRSSAVLFVLVGLLLGGFLFQAFPGHAAEEPGIRWGEDRIVALGQAVGPSGAASPGSARLLARRGAVMDLQRNLLEYVQGVRVDAKTTMENYMAHDEVRTSVEGTIKGVEIWRSSWDGEIYSVWGGFSLQKVRQAGAPRIPGLASRSVPSYDEKGYSSLVLDLGDIPFEPSLVISIRSASGKKIYGPEFVDEASFVERGMCRYEEHGGSWKSSFLPSFLKGTPAWAEEKALVISQDIHMNDAGEIVISDEAAEVIERNSFDFRIPCEVTVITKTAALRGFLDSFFVFRASSNPGSVENR